MSKRKFSEAERLAIYEAHEGTCMFCGHRCDYAGMQIDHVLPESLLNSPDKLAATLRDFSFPEDFEINSWENFAPTHPQCNRVKSDRIYMTTMLMQHVIERARERGLIAKDLYAQKTSRAKIARAIGVIQRAAERGELTEDDIQKLSVQTLTPVAASPVGSFMETLLLNALDKRSNSTLKFLSGGQDFTVSSAFETDTLKWFTKAEIGPSQIRATMTFEVKASFCTISFTVSASFHLKRETPPTDVKIERIVFEDGGHVIDLQAIKAIE